MSDCLELSYSSCGNHPRFALDAATAAIPEPGKANLGCGNKFVIPCPDCLLSIHSFNRSQEDNVSACHHKDDGLLYALSQKIRKSFAAGVKCANLLNCFVRISIAPVGLEYFGTHQIPLIAGSSATNFSTISISGPVGRQRYIDHFNSKILCNSQNVCRIPEPDIRILLYLICTMVCFP